jgi:NADP-dependent 3-hydroxy acid dehydrogenase YdfG
VDWRGKKYWLIGASEGLGREVALALSRAGAEVIVSARNADRLAELVAALPGKGRAVPVDVQSRESVDAAAAEIGPIDGMVYLAGVYWPMKATEWRQDEALQMADINFMGGLRAVGAVLPGMVERGAGHIVLTGSLSGFRGLPGAIGYGASKSGLMHLAENLQADLRRTPIRVQLINPGFIRTRLTDKNDFSMPFIMDADAAAREFFEHMNDEELPLRLQSGLPAFAVPAGLALLPAVRGQGLEQRPHEGQRHGGDGPHGCAHHDPLPDLHHPGAGGRQGSADQRVIGKGEQVHAVRIALRPHPVCLFRQGLAIARGWQAPAIA